ncbi:hypothetical protein CRG98_012652 [Punica granatum]|uniref:Uncharacterized protein n=1 Tax=Punica granatum TaxID=22663 RepID=A0A2I0KEQ4_PUNGR|nr:hypothetical protein CRG98_012652 [Punica granatum]
MEGPIGKGEESSKKASAAPTSSSGIRGKEFSVNTVNPVHPTSQQYSVNFTSAQPVVPTYTLQVPQYRPQPPAQLIYYSAPPFPLPPAASSPVVHHYTSAPLQALQYRPPASRAPQPTQQVPPPQGQQGGATQLRPRRQYPSLPVPFSHIYQQLRVGDKIGTIAPGPNFDPTTQDQTKHCEYHRGAPGNTLDNCWRLQERIQEIIDAKELSFNAVRPPNV